MDIHDLSGGMMDLPDDILGKPVKPDLDCRFVEPSTGKGLEIPDEFWQKTACDNPAGNLHRLDCHELVPGTVNQGRPDPYMAGRKIRAFKKYAMSGKSPVECAQYARREFAADESVSNPDIQRTVDNAGLTGVVFIDGGAFGSCGEVAAFMRQHKRTRTAAYMVKCPECTVKMADGVCPIARLPVVSCMEFTPVTVKTCVARLQGAGRILGKAEIKSKDDLYQALYPEKAPEPTRMYQAPVYPAKPAINLNNALADLAASKQNDEALQDHMSLQLAIRSLRPYIHQALILMAGIFNNKALKNELRARFTPDTIQKLGPYLSLFFHDPLLRLRIALNSRYASDCKKMASILKSKEITIPFVISKPRCLSGCRNLVNGHCQVYHSKVVSGPQEIPKSQILFALDNLRSSGKISRQQAEEYKAMEAKEPVSGCRAAFMQHHPVMVRQAATAEPVNSFFDSGISFLSEQDTIKKVRTAFEARHTASSVRNRLAGQYPGSKVDQLVYAALSAMSVIDANTLDDCMVSKHVLNGRTRLVKAAKCGQCRYATLIGCSYQNLEFSVEPPTQDNANDAGREIASYFEGSGQMTVEYLPKRKDATVDVEFENPGQDIDIGAQPPPLVENGNFQKFFEGSDQMKVEINPEPDRSPLDSTDGFATDWDLSGVL